jgi:hypothetical protein
MVVVEDHGSIVASKKSRNSGRGKYFLYPVARPQRLEQRKCVRVNHPVKSHAERKNEPREDYTPSGRSLGAAITAIAATYAYFLIFAQFGFLHALSEASGEDHAWLKPILAVMGVAGIAGSVLMVRIPEGTRRRGGMGAGFLLAGGAAGLTWVARNPALFALAAALTGLGTGMITVGLAGMLRRETGDGRLGRCIGIGTGLAYAICNLPPVFNAGPQAQAGLGIAAAAVGWIAVRSFAQRVRVPGATGSEYGARAIALWTLVLLALVTLDSAAFYHIQHTPSLKENSWSGSAQLLLNAGSHLLAGLLAGVALDRGLIGSTSLLATLMMAVATALTLAGRGVWGAPLYAASVSVYSAVLVFYPARSGRIGVAAGVYAVAGWAGSALGIGIAEHAGRIPGWWLVSAPLAVGCLLVSRPRRVQ